MFTEDGGTTMGEDEAEEEPDEPVDDLHRAILDSQINSGTENERLKLESMLEDHKKMLYPNCEDGQKKIGTTLELLQWNAENGITDRGFENLLKIIKKLLPRDNVLPPVRTKQRKLCAL